MYLSGRAVAAFSRWKRPQSDNETLHVPDELPRVGQQLCEPRLFSLERLEKDQELIIYPHARTLEKTLHLVDLPETFVDKLLPFHHCLVSLHESAQSVLISGSRLKLLDHSFHHRRRSCASGAKQRHKGPPCCSKRCFRNLRKVGAQSLAIHEHDPSGPLRAETLQLVLERRQELRFFRDALEGMFPRSESIGVPLLPIGVDLGV
mmetsp:Transcript_33289/g.91789  ORF Transcript_33289/g.91789 Transcript_33289/m.91789 type:complete len:205 (-) Transcript_33289:558-1172(-)